MCGASLLPAAAPAREERKVVTILFTDLVGSTARAEGLDPEDVSATLSAYYAQLRAELERHGGTVEKFIGDAVVALFGAPVAHEDDPERAVRAALALRTAIDELNAEDEWLDLKIRVGVNTGEALVVVGARTTEGEGMAAGDAIRHSPAGRTKDSRALARSRGPKQAIRAMKNCFRSRSGRVRAACDQKSSQRGRGRRYAVSRTSIGAGVFSYAAC